MLFAAIRQLFGVDKPVTDEADAPHFVMSDKDQFEAMDSVLDYAIAQKDLEK
jgi:hypothetical protein